MIVVGRESFVYSKMASLSSVLSGISTNWKVLSVDILLLAVLVVLLQTFLSWYRLRAFKGPFLATFSDLWLIRQSALGRVHMDFFDVTEKYGMLRISNSLLIPLANK
jgi:hypothetical protein